MPTGEKKGKNITRKDPEIQAIWEALQRGDIDINSNFQQVLEKVPKAAERYGRDQHFQANFPQYWGRSIKGKLRTDPTIGHPFGVGNAEPHHSDCAPPPRDSEVLQEALKEATARAEGDSNGTSEVPQQPDDGWDTYVNPEDNSESAKMSSTPRSSTTPRSPPSRSNNMAPDADTSFEALMRELSIGTAKVRVYDGKKTRITEIAYLDRSGNQRVAIKIAGHCTNYKARVEPGGMNLRIEWDLPDHEKDPSGIFQYIDLRYVTELQDPEKLAEYRKLKTGLGKVKNLQLSQTANETVKLPIQCLEKIADDVPFKCGSRLMIPSSKDNALKYEPVVMWVLKGARMNQEEEDDDASDNDGGLYAAGTPTLSCFTSPLSVTPLEVTSGLVGQPHNSVGSPLNLQLQQLRQQLQMQQRVPQPHLQHLSTPPQMMHLSSPPQMMHLSSPPQMHPTPPQAYQIAELWQRYPVEMQKLYQQYPQNLPQQQQQQQQQNPLSPSEASTAGFSTPTGDAGPETKRPRT